MDASDLQYSLDCADERIADLEAAVDDAQVALSAAINKINQLEMELASARNELARLRAQRGVPNPPSPAKP